LPDLETLLADIENGRIAHILRQRKPVDAPPLAD